MTDTLAWIMFAVLVAMCLVVGLAMSTPEVEGGHGQTHPLYDSMQSAAPGDERHRDVLWIGWAFGATQIVFFIACIGLGLRQGSRLGRRAVPLFVGGAIYLAAFTAMVVAYRQYMITGETSFFLDFPVPTAWMLYAVWPVPMWFLFVYVLMFDRWIVTPQSIARFRQIVDARRRREKDAA